MPQPSVSADVMLAFSMLYTVCSTPEIGPYVLVSNMFCTGRPASVVHILHSLSVIYITPSVPVNNLRWQEWLFYSS